MSNRNRVIMLCAVAATIAWGGVAVAEDLDQTTGLPVVIVPEQPIPGGDREYDVLWDLTHGVYLQYSPSGNYAQLVSLLAGEGFTVHTTDLGIHNIDLSVYDALVVCLGSNWNSAYTQPEVEAAMDFVAGGGGILVMGDNPNCPNANINPISQAYGTTCGTGSCAADVTNFITHPIFSGVSHLYCGAPGALASVPPAVEAAWATDGRLMITIAEECGGMVVIGDINFCDNTNLNTYDNRIFAVNTFYWLAGLEPSPAEAGTWGAIKALYK